MELQAGNMISQIKQISSRIFARILSEHNIDAFNGAQGRILYALWKEEFLSLKELAERTGLAATTLTSMIDRMESAGLVCRIPDPSDRRKIRIALTDKARELQPEYTAVSEKMNKIVYAGFSEEDIRRCEAMLLKIHENLKRKEREDKRMNQMVKENAVKKVKELMQAPSCCAEAKAVAQNWLDALGTDKEAQKTKDLIAELEMDIMPVDGLIAFAGSQAGTEVFGEEMAKNVKAHGEELKASGAKYCDCPACAAVAAILEMKEELLSANE